MKLKTGDNVRITAGKDKGKTGKITQVFPVLGKVVVEGVNKTVKHVKGRGKQAGQRIEYFAPIHASNVVVVGKNASGRVGYKMIEKDGVQHKVRVLRAKKTVEDLE